MTNDFDDYKKQPTVCLYKQCIDCPLLPMCEKDENEYDSEKAEKYKNSLYCPKCGFVLIQTTDGLRVCFVCHGGFDE